VHTGTKRRGGLMAETFNNGEEVTVTYPPNYNRKKEMVCSGVIRGKIKDKEEYVVKLYSGQVVYIKTEMIERGLL
jgi:hypothetical protein